MKSRSAVVLAVCIWLGVMPASGQILRPLCSIDVPKADLMAVLPGGQLGATALSGLGQLFVFDLASGRPVAKLEGLPPSASFLAFDEKNGWLLAASPRQVVRWRLSDFRIREHYELQLQPEGEGAIPASRYSYDPTRELLFRSVGSDLYCYSLLQEGQGKYLKRKTQKGEAGAPRPAQLMQAPKREELWVLDTERGELRIIGLEYFRERRRLSVPGALAMAVDNERVAVLCREQGQYQLNYYDDRLEKQASYPIPALLPGPDTLMMAFTGRQMLSITGYGRVWDLSLETGQLSSFEFGRPYQAAFFLPDGKLAIRIDDRLQIIGSRGRLQRQHRLTFSPLLLWDASRESAFLLDGTALRDKTGKSRMSLHPDDAFAPVAALHDGQLIVSGRQGALVRYDLDRATRQPLTEGRENIYSRLLVLPECRRIAAWSLRDGEVTLINFTDGKKDARLTAVQGKITALTHHDGRLYIGDSEGGVAVWSISGSPFLEDYHYLSEEPVEALALSADGTWALAGGKAGIITCRMPCFEISAILPGHDNAVGGFHFAPSGTRFLSMAGDAVVKVWDTASGQLLENISLGEDTPWDARFLRKGEDMLLLSSRGQLLERRTNVQARGLKSPPEATRLDVATEKLLTAMSSDGKLTAVLPAASGEIVIWDNASGAPAQRIAVADREKLSVMSFWENQPILILADDSVIEYWDAHTGRLLKKFDYRAVSPNLSTLYKEAGSNCLWAITKGGNELLQLNALSGEVISKKRLDHPDSGLPEQLRDLAVSPGGGRLALRGDGGIYLYDTRKGEPLAFIRRPPEEVGSPWGAMAFSPGAQLLAVASPERAEIIVFDIVREALFFRAPGEKAAFLDQRRLAVARNDAERGASIDIWDYLRGEPLGTVQIHSQGRLEGLEAHAGLLVTTDERGHIRYWEGKSLRRQLPGVEAPAYELTEMFPLQSSRKTVPENDLTPVDWSQKARPAVKQVEDKAAALFTVTKSTSLRTGAGAVHQVLLRLHDGDVVEVVEETADPFWTKVRFKERTGWAKKALLKKMRGR